MKKSIWIVVAIIIVLAIILLINKGSANDSDTIKIGWISDLSGSAKKYGAYEAAKLAEAEINAAGGINGKKLELIYEDGKCNSKEAINAANKLVGVDKVKVILGGHCTPESATIAPVAEANKVIMLAAITSSPVLSARGDYIFRTTSISTVQSQILADLIFKDLKLKKLAIVFEQTDYARPIAEALKSSFENLGGNVSISEAFTAETNDFKSILAKVKAGGVEAVFFSPQRLDAGLNLIKQSSELGLKAKILANDVAASQIVINQIPQLAEGLIFAGPKYDPVNNPKTKQFEEKFKAMHGFDVPYGIFTAESYDGVYIIADAISKNGMDVEKIRNHLSNLKNYQGASGTISIDEKHDGEREYVPKIIRNGKPELYQN